MKGLVLAGGLGTRLRPLTSSVSKQLLPIYDKPMIYYPIANLMSFGIRDIGVISAPEQLNNFKSLLGDGSQWGVSFSFIAQPKPLGIAQAILEAAQFLNSSAFSLVLGDNLFDGIPCQSVSKKFKDFSGAHIFAYKVANPSRYGVLDIDAQGSISRLVEKPKSFISDLAIPGLYFFDNSAVLRASSLEFSNRGELEITDLLELFLSSKELSFELLPEGSAWLDTGTIESMFQAGEYVKVLQNRQGRLIGSPEQSALSSGFITEGEYLELAKQNSSSGYGELLLNYLRDFK